MGDLRTNETTEIDYNVRSEHANRLITTLIIARIGNLDKVDEYVGEAEHQDGYGYWNQFATAAELIEDFDLYCEYP